MALAHKTYNSGEYNVAGANESDINWIMMNFLCGFILTMFSVYFITWALVMLYRHQVYIAIARGLVINWEDRCLYRGVLWAIAGKQLWNIKARQQIVSPMPGLFWESSTDLCSGSEHISHSLLQCWIIVVRSWFGSCHSYITVGVDSSCGCWTEEEPVFALCRLLMTIGRWFLLSFCLLLLFK